jgi:hypothetical protein
MSRYETTITDRLRAAAERIPVEPSPPTVADRRTATVVSRAPSRRLLVAGAVAATVTAVAVLAAVWPTTDSPTVEVGPPAATSVDGSAIPPPPGWFGEPQAGVRDEGRSGRWASTAIGRVSTDGVAAPIVASVFDGTYAALDKVPPVTIDGVPLRSVRFGDSLVLATTAADTPTVVVSGPDDERLLASVLQSVEVVDPGGELSLRLRSRPDGYTEVVAPRALGPTPATRETLASESGDTAIDRPSDVGDPLLAAANSGADLTAVDVGAATGWLGRTRHLSREQLTFLVWSPRPGVVYEVTTDDADRSVDELVELALWASEIDAADWDALHD